MFSLLLLLLLSTKFEVSSATHYEDTKAARKYREWGGFG